MFRQMRRKNQQLSLEEAKEILTQVSTGILSVNGDNGYPYPIPINYLYQQGKIYVHCAKTGHKIEAIANNPKVCFCVVAKDKVVPSHFATDYCSVVVFGRAKIVDDWEATVDALRGLNEKYCSPYMEKGEAEIKKAKKAVAIIEITPEHITAKAASPAIQKAAQDMDESGDF